MPTSLHNVTGTIKDIFGNLLVGATVSVSHTTIDPVLTDTTDSDGVYTVNLGNLDEQWSIGEELIIAANKTAEGRITLTTPITSGGGQTHNLTLAETSDFDFERQPELADRYPFTMAMITHYDGEQVTRLRPLPVQAPIDVDLVYNPSHIWVITNQDGQPDSETVTLIDGNSYKRTFTYSTVSGARMLTSRSKWVKQ